jgi:hypothetical protein
MCAENNKMPEACRVLTLEITQQEKCAGGCNIFASLASVICRKTTFVESLIILGGQISKKVSIVRVIKIASAVLQYHALFLPTSGLNHRKTKKKDDVNSFVSFHLSISVAFQSRLTILPAGCVCQHTSHTRCCQSFFW